MKLSKFTLFLGAYIVLSAYFMQQVFTTWKTIFGKNILLLFFIFLCLWAIFAILCRSINYGFNIKKVALICVICVVGFIFAWRQPYISEKSHILEYGLLAWLAMRDLSRSKTGMLKSVLYTFIFILIIGSLDEGHQKLLPWRVFEGRDILTNVLSGMLGTVLFIIK